MPFINNLRFPKEFKQNLGRELSRFDTREMSEQILENIVKLGKTIESANMRDPASCFRIFIQINHMIYEFGKENGKLEQAITRSLQSIAYYALYHLSCNFEGTYNSLRSRHSAAIDNLLEDIPSDSISHFSVGHKSFQVLKSTYVSRWHLYMQNKLRLKPTSLHPENIAPTYSFADSHHFNENFVNPASIEKFVNHLQYVVLLGIPDNVKPGTCELNKTEGEKLMAKAQTPLEQRWAKSLLDMGDIDHATTELEKSRIATRTLLNDLKRRVFPELFGHAEVKSVEPAQPILLGM